MNDKNRKKEQYGYPDPWEQSTYQTGHTHMPERHGGGMAVVLVVIIFLFGIISALSLLNIRLFQELNAQPGDDDSAVSFQSTTEATSETGSQNTGVDPSVSPDPDVTLDIKDTPESVDNIPQTGGLSLQEIYTKNIDSVVSITCSGHYGTSSGTGVVLSDNGYIVTNCHVVADALTVQVRCTDDRVFQAVIVGTDEVSDLAVLYVSATDLVSAEFGDSAALRVGDLAVAIGDPLGAELRGTMTDGIISAINRDISVEGRTMTLIQTNAALNSGNSGGPLINCYGQVIGINTMKFGDNMSTAGVEGLGFAIPSTTVKEIVDQIIAQGYVSGRPGIGIEGEAVSAFYQMYYGLPAGLQITAVAEGSNAHAQKLQPGDILLKLDDRRITGMDDLNAALQELEVGDRVQAVIYRGRRQYTVTLTIEEAKG